MIVLAAGFIRTAILIDIILITSYCTTSHCHLESCANTLMKDFDRLTASYSRLSLQLASSSLQISLTLYLLHRIIQLPPLSVPLKVVLTISRNSSIFSQHLIHDWPCGWHHPYLHFHPHRTCRIVLYYFQLSLRELC